MTTQSGSSHARFAELLDSKFKIPNTNIRFGIDPILGLVPGVGDWLGAAISSYFLIAAAWSGGSAAVLGRMFINILLDLLIGAIPILGEAFDIYWKANERNAKILQELETNPEATTSESRLWVWFVVIQCIVILLGIILLIGWLIAEIIGLLL